MDETLQNEPKDKMLGKRLLAWWKEDLRFHNGWKVGEMRWEHSSIVQPSKFFFQDDPIFLDVLIGKCDQVFQHFIHYATFHIINHYMQTTYKWKYVKI
jgi:hypothetical protein